MGNKRATSLSYWSAVVLIACSSSIALPAVADIFHFVDEDGTSHFSDQASDTRYQLFLHADSAQRAPTTEPSLHPLGREVKMRLDGEISAAAKVNRIDPALLHALIEIESGYNAKAVSPKGALGLMQLMPATARRYGVIDPLDAVQSLRGGARHLRDLLDQFSQDKELALAAYNAGAAAVLAYGRHIPPYAQTRRYVPAVLQNYELLRARYRAPAEKL